MEKGLAWSACLIAAAGTTAIAMIGFSTWRYDVALDRAAAALRAVTSRHDRFQRLASQLGASGPGAGAPSRARAVAANAHYYSLFTRARGVAGTTSGPQHGGRRAGGSRGGRRAAAGR